MSVLARGDPETFASAWLIGTCKSEQNTTKHVEGTHRGVCPELVTTEAPF